MKKKIIFNGVCAKLALAIVGLVTAMFTSCSNEDIQIAVKPVNAKAEINPVVFVDGAATAVASITFSEGNGVYEGNPALAAKSITVTASYDGLTGSVVVNIPALSAGQSWSQSAVIVLTRGLEFYEVVATKTEETGKDVLEKAFDNPSNYWYEVPVTYENTYTSQVLPGYTYDSSVEGILDLINSYNFDESTEETKEYPVYAQSRLIVNKVITTIQTTFEVRLKSRVAKTVIATFIVEENTTALSANSNAQIPGHSHNPNGHGHGEGTNAGGGIIFAD